MQIPDLKAFRARALFNGGFKTVEDVATADVQRIADACVFCSFYSLEFGARSHSLSFHTQIGTGYAFQSAAV